MAHDVHDLTAAYALDAVDDAERTEYERHLGSCERCRAELAELQETASMLAYAVASPAPPETLRARILEGARAERSNVVPLRRRPVLTYTLGAVAAAAAAVALAVGFWASGVADERDELREALGDPRAQIVELPSGQGRLVVAPGGGATLVVDHAEAPRGKVYAAWVVADGDPEPAGVFEGGERVVRLTRAVPPGASVAVTIEDEDGANAPTTKPLYVLPTRGS